MVDLLTGLEPLAQRYRGVIVDLWGVLHDGGTAFPGALRALAGLKAAGVQVQLLSNAPRQVAPVAARLTELGYPPESYDHLLTSGETTWRLLMERTDPFFAALGERVYFLGASKDESMLTGGYAQRVERLEDAQFILNTGAEFGHTVEMYEALLQQARSLTLPMVCANPDRVVIHHGRREICAGTLAERYLALGGVVREVGKPHREVYTHCLAALGLEPVDVLAIGDSLTTDIAGAAQVGMDSLLIADGIFAEDLGLAPGGPGLSADAVVALATRLALPAPTYAMPLLDWAAA
ncbi:MAG: TIGR01459 family HAD-type hydrolase [Alphaproteobacteria bacterium]|nr:TIGR01459 family HAD-type hydrolase [Alphaproteobacteria bacterium]